MTENPNLKKALDYIAQGKRVIPIDADGKPVTYNGNEGDATSDPQMAAMLWLVWPDADVGVVDEEFELMVIRRASELEAQVQPPAQLSGPPVEAMRLLHVLDPCGKFTFQSFDDRRENKRQEMTRVYHGTLEQHHAKLKRLNDDGAGIFFTVNETDLRGREASNIIRVRALYVDLDGAPLGPVVAWRKPHMVVESSPDRWHCYWLVRDLPLEDFKRAQQWLIAKFNSDNQVCDLPRVMRLPGYAHQKEA